MPEGLVAEFTASKTEAKTRLKDLERELESTEDFAEAWRIVENRVRVWRGRKKGKEEKELKPLRLQQLKAEFKALAKADGIGAGHVANYLGYIDTFISAMKKMYPKLVYCDDVSDAHGKEYLKWLLGSGLASSTVSKHASAMRTVFRRMEDRIGTSKIPIPAYKAVAAETEHHWDFTEEQLDAIRVAAEADKWIGPVVIVGMETGLRLGDAATLAWTSIDLEIGMIDHECRKTADSSEENAACPISPRLGGFLRTQKRKGQYVLPDQATRYLSSELDTSLSDAFRRFLRKVSKSLQGTEHSFEINKKRKKGVRAVAQYGFGSFRSTFITKALREGKPIEAIRLAVGHVDDSMIRKFYDRRNRGEKLRLYRSWWDSGLKEEDVQLRAKLKDTQGMLIEVQEVVASTTAENFPTMKRLLLRMLAMGINGLGPTNSGGSCDSKSA
ncbi:site-specific recombinase, phage integrase family protein [Verrucomicrobiia bacterium DG1235]|nr:site-specific recombinase, phage integrase family protein [Verrucomicrobiae bacterium DG1235]